MTTTPIPADIMQAATNCTMQFKPSNDSHWTDFVAEAILEERQRCANATWDFWYGVHRGNISIEDMASFLKAGLKQTDEPA